MKVESIRLRLLLIGPVRLVLGIVLLAAARAVGGSSAGTLVAFAAAALALAFLIPNDPRARFRRRADEEPGELPADARVAPAWQHGAHAALPSTVGISALGLVILPFRPTLAALLAGILAGLGLAALYAAYGFDDRLYVEPRRHLVFRN